MLMVCVLVYVACICANIEGINSSCVCVVCFQPSDIIIHHTLLIFLISITIVINFTQFFHYTHSQHQQHIYLQKPLSHCSYVFKTQRYHIFKSWSGYIVFTKAHASSEFPVGLGRVVWIDVI